MSNTPKIALAGKCKRRLMTKLTEKEREERGILLATPQLDIIKLEDEAKNKANDYMIDRQLQKEKVFTGIVGINTQDFALQEGMGHIVDRTREHLGSTDRAIITMRAMLLRAIDTVEKGGEAPGADPQTHRGMRPFDNFVKAGEDWRAIFESETKAKW